jgi:ADP-dependent phosphofructokinase/glucokinase
MTAADDRPILGLQGTVDFEATWDPVVFGALATKWGVRADELADAGPVHDERAMLVALLSLVEAGRGGELFVASSDVVRSFAARLDVAVTLGGTGVRAAMAMREQGAGARVHLVSTDDNVRRLLPASIGVISSAVGDTLDPHLIFQYPAGTEISWDDVSIVAPHPNRVIFVNDPPARELVLSPELGVALRKTPLFLLSGLNAIQEGAVLADRVMTLRSHIGSMLPDSLVIYEDAGFHVDHFGSIALAGLQDAVDIVSLNEDELEAQAGRSVELDDPHALADAINLIRAVAPHPTLVLHTKHFALAVGPLALSLGMALCSGIRTASARYMHGDIATAAQVVEIEGLPPSPVGESIRDALPALLTEPVSVIPAYLLETETPTTVGLGDTFQGGFVAALLKQRTPGRSFL